MSAKTEPLAQRRAEIQQRIKQDRAAVEEAFGRLKKRLAVAETVVGAAQRAGRHRLLTGLLAVAAIVVPLTARSWLKRAAWMLPLVLEGLRLARRRRDADGEPAD